MMEISDNRSRDTSIILGDQLQVWDSNVSWKKWMINDCGGMYPYISYPRLSEVEV